MIERITKYLRENTGEREICEGFRKLMKEFSKCHRVIERITKYLRENTRERDVCERIFKLLRKPFSKFRERT